MTQTMENLHRSAGRPVSGHATDRILLAGAAIQLALVPPRSWPSSSTTGR